MNTEISDIQNKIQPLLNQGIAVSYFQVIGEQDTLKCFHSHSKSYQTGQSYTLFEIPSLLRLLAQKNKVIPPKMRISLSKSGDNEICFIVDWSPLIKRVITFQFSDTAIYSKQTLEDVFKNKDGLLTDYFTKLHKR